MKSTDRKIEIKKNERAEKNAKRNELDEKKQAGKIF